MAKAKEVVKKNGAPVEAQKEAKKTTAAAPTGSWFQKGDAGFERKHQQDEFARMRKEKGAPRFYLKTTPGAHLDDEGKDNEATLVFVDSVGFWIHEHNLKLEGKWGNFFTCTKEFQPCEICNQLNEKPTYTCYFTVIDTRMFRRKDGTQSKNRKVLYPAKGAAIDVIEGLKKQHGDLRGLVVNVKRAGDRDPNCGRDFNVVIKDGKVRRVDPGKLAGELGQPYDYMKILAPPTPQELEVAGVSPTHVVGSDDDLDTSTVGSVASTSNGNGEDVSELLGD